jgi:uncharacterized MAPEG superfamily protein
MTTDLWILLASAGLQWALIMLAATPPLMINGIPWAVGNRQSGGKKMPAWAVRARKASDNMAENLVLFAVVVLVVHVAGAANETSTLGAQVFLGGRVGHALLYIAGVAWLRTAAWLVGVAGTLMVVSVLL